MATAKLYNLARMTTATTGTGTITLGSAATGFISFATAGVSDGESITYAIEDGNNREIGRGTYTAAGTTLTRSVLKSTNAGSAISLSGSAQVFITDAAEDHIAGPASATDNAVVRFDGTGGATLQNSVVTVADTTGTLSTSGGGDLGVVTTAPWGSLFMASGKKLDFNAGDVTVTHSANSLAFAGASSGYTFDAAPLPSANDGAALGASGTAWADLFLASGGVINWNAGDVTATHSANALAFAGASSGYSFDAVVAPATSDGAALGSTTLMWSDAFLASGAVINWNNGNVTLTHAAGALTVAGATTVSLGTSAAFTTGTIELGAASDTTLSRSAAGILAVEGVDQVRTAGNQTLTGGFSITSYSGGSQTGASPTYTPAAANGNIQHITLNGSSLTGTFTVGVPSTVCSIVLEIVNGGSGSVGATFSTSGYTKTTGDTWASTNGNKYAAFITKTNSYSHFHLQALQ